MKVKSIVVIFEGVGNWLLSKPLFELVDYMKS